MFSPEVSEQKNKDSNSGFGLEPSSPFAAVEMRGFYLRAAQGFKQSTADVSRNKLLSQSQRETTAQLWTTFTSTVADVIDLQECKKYLNIFKHQLLFLSVLHYVCFMVTSIIICILLACSVLPEITAFALMLAPDRKKEDCRIHPLNIINTQTKLLGNSKQMLKSFSVALMVALFLFLQS